MIYELEEFPQEFVQKQQAFDIIQKAFDLGKIDAATFLKAQDVIEKARRDLSRLKKIQKIIIRDGKPVLATFYIKPDGSEVEDEKVPKEEVHKDTPEASIGKNISLTLTNGGKIEGVLARVSAKGRHGVTQFFIETSPGIFKSVTVTKIKKAEVKKSSVSKTEPKLDDSAFEYDFSKAKKIKDLGGSGDNILTEDDSGNYFTVKKPRARETGIAQLKEEVQADRIYRAMGFDAPHSIITKDSEGKEIKVAKYVDGVKEYNALSTSAKNKAKEEIKKGFVLDCLLANWDVIGANYDNVLCSSDGAKVMRVDNGGSLRYRAKGAEKGSSFSSEVTEIDSLRNKSTNPSAAEIFSSITDEDIAKQVKELSEKWPLLINSVEDVSLKKILISRKQNLESRFSEEAIKAKTDLELRKRLEEEKRKKEEDERLKKEAEERKKLGSYPSATTRDYFESDAWKNLELDGNKKIKQGIAEKIIEIEKNYERALSRTAERRGETVEEFKKKFQEKVQEFVRSSECFIAVHSQKEGGVSVMDLIFKDGKFKTQFETKTSRGSLSPSSRMRTEYSYFKFEERRGEGFDDKRPVYGYFSVHENGVINQEGRIPPPNVVSQYGDASFKIKRKIAERKATITFQDSLGSENNQAATPFAYPHFTSAMNLIERDKDPIDFLDEAIIKRKSANPYSYVEAQYHGGLHLEDVESVNISPGSFRVGDLSSQLKKVSTAINSIKDYAASTGKKDLQINIF